jgi:hypothetical protein
MTEAWIRLVCPACEAQWEANPADLPPSGEPFDCHNCGARRSVSEFPRTEREFEILEQFSG